MKKTILTIASVLTAASLFTSCSNLGTTGTDILNNPQVQAILSQIEQFAIQFAENYIVSHLGARKSKVTIDNVSATGRAELSAALVAKFGITHELADTEASAAFAKVTAK